MSADFIQVDSRHLPNEQELHDGGAGLNDDRHSGTTVTLMRPSLNTDTDLHVQLAFVS
jgi:hypothetical protein